MMGGEEEPVAIRPPDGSVIRLAQLGRASADGVEDGLNIGPRARDDAKDLAGRPLLLLPFRSSRVSRATSVSLRAVEPRRRTAFRVFALRLCALASLLLALERRRIAHPKGLGLRQFSKSITAGICGRRNGYRSNCAAKFLNCACPLMGWFGRAPAPPVTN